MDLHGVLPSNVTVYRVSNGGETAIGVYLVIIGNKSGVIALNSPYATVKFVLELRYIERGHVRESVNLIDLFF